MPSYELHWELLVSFLYTLCVVVNNLSETSIPSTHHLNLKLLDFSHNNICKVLRGAFSDLVIKTLDLCHNHINYIERGAFNNVYELKILRLCGNKLQSGMFWFYSTPKVILSNNMFVYFPGDIARGSCMLNLSYNQVSDRYSCMYVTFSRILHIVIAIECGSLSSCQISHHYCRTTRCPIFMQSSTWLLQ